MAVAFFSACRRHHHYRPIFGVRCRRMSFRCCRLITASIFASIHSLSMAYRAWGGGWLPSALSISPVAGHYSFFSSACFAGPDYALHIAMATGRGFTALILPMTFSAQFPLSLVCRLFSSPAGAFGADASAASNIRRQARRRRRRHGHRRQSSTDCSGTDYSRRRFRAALLAGCRWR